MMKLTAGQMEKLIEIVHEKSQEMHKELMATEDKNLAYEFAEVIKLWEVLVRGTQQISFKLEIDDKG